jgi:hypothetical protein
MGEQPIHVGQQRVRIHAEREQARADPIRARDLARYLVAVRASGNRAEQPEWVRLMASRRRKTLIICRDCHDGIHNGFPERQALRNAALESDVR